MRVRALCLAGLVAGCSSYTTLAPSPDARLASGPGRGVGAFEEAAGIRLEARFQAWSGKPKYLRKAVTPVLVKIENDGERPLRVRYDDFTLVDGKGKAYAAMPVYDLEGSVREMVHPAYPAHGFLLAPHIHHYYSGFRTYRGGFLHDPFYYGLYYPQMQRYELPTGDMVTMALPEGVLETGGRIAGFLYFQKLDKEAVEATLRARLVDGETNGEMDFVSIPFAADR